MSTIPEVDSLGFHPAPPLHIRRKIVVDIVLRDIDSAMRQGERFLKIDVVDKKRPETRTRGQRQLVRGRISQIARIEIAARDDSDGLRRVMKRIVKRFELGEDPLALSRIGSEAYKSRCCNISNARPDIDDVDVDDEK